MQNDHSGKTDGAYTKRFQTQPVTRVMYKSLKTVIELTASLLCDRREGLGIQEMMDWCPMCVVEREHLSCFMPQKQEISCLAITSA